MKTQKWFDNTHHKGFANIGLIIILVLILGGVGYYLAKQSPKETTPAKEEAPSIPTKETVVSSNQCGFTIISPEPNDLVSFPLSISGIYDSTMNTPNCTWVVFESYAGTIEVFDSNNNKVGYSSIPLGPNWLTQLTAPTPSPISFTVTVSLTSTPATSNLTLVFTEDSAAGGPLDTLIIPVSLLN